MSAPQLADVAPIVRAAITALDLFGAVSQREARPLLSVWARRDQLTPEQVETVLGHYSDRPPVLEYVREVEEPAGGPLPAHVEGIPLGGRHEAQP